MIIDLISQKQWLEERVESLGRAILWCREIGLDYDILRDEADDHVRQLRRLAGEDAD